MGVPKVLEVMKASGNLAAQVDKACLKLTEAVVLQPWVGQDFTATVLHAGADSATSTIFVENPPVIAECRGNASDGAPEEAATVKVTLVTAPR